MSKSSTYLTLINALNSAYTVYDSAKDAEKKAKIDLANCTGQSIVTIWCERAGSCKLPPGMQGNPKAHYIYNCPNKIEGLLNINVSCPGEWWKCDGKNICPRKSDHVVLCKGDCGDMIGPDRVNRYHSVTCDSTSSYLGCGEKYRKCSGIQKKYHRNGSNGKCPNRPNAYHACRIHYTTVSGSHTSTTPPCGVSAHANYACQITSTHKDTVNCPKDSNNQECSYQTYYACSEHVHAYPTPPTVSCGRSACVESVSSSTEHKDSCVSGHTWWSCGKYADHNAKKHRVRTCRYTECRQSWQNCMTDNPVCNKSNRKAQGKKCWAEDV